MQIEAVTEEGKLKNGVVCPKGKLRESKRNFSSMSIIY